MSGTLPKSSESLTQLTNLLNKFSVDLTVVVDEHIGTVYGGNAELKAIVALYRGGTHTRSALAKVAGLSPRSVTILVRRMEARGIVEVAADPADRRAVLISPTPSGRRTFRKLGHALEDLYANTQPMSKEIVDLLAPGGIGDLTWPATDSFGMLEICADVGLELQAAIRSRQPGEELVGRQQLAVLRLACTESARPTELADFLAMSSGGLTYVINQLDAAGLVERGYGADASDRRAVSISLTEGGREIAAAILDGIGATGSRLVELFAQLRDRPRR